MDEILKNSLATVKESEVVEKPRENKAEEVMEQVGSVVSDGESIVEKADSDSSISEELQIFNDNTIGSSDVTKISPFLGKNLLPPRAPVSATEIDTDQRLLASQPSIIRRMMEPNKRYVDPKDARTLLPGVLFQSGSLDLEGAIEDGATEIQKQQQQQQQLKESDEARANEKLQKEALLFQILQNRDLQRINESLLLGQQQQQQQDSYLAASSLDLLASQLNEQCRVAAANNNSFLVPPSALQQESTVANNLYPQMMQRPRHMRSASEPIYSFQDAIQSVSPFHPSLTGTGNAAGNCVNPQPPLVDPSAETLALLGLATGATTTAATTAAVSAANNVTATTVGINFQPPTPQSWLTSDLQQANVPNFFGNDPSASLMNDLLNQQQQQLQQQQESLHQHQHQPHPQTQQGKIRRKTGPSRSVDFTQTKLSKHKVNAMLVKEKPSQSFPSAPFKTPSKAEVKNLVDKQTKHGKPTYAPWFREKTGPIPRNTNNNNNMKDDFQIGGKLHSPRLNRNSSGVPAHHRSQSTPGITLNMLENDALLNTPPSTTSTQTSKGKGAGTGVFLPRLPT